MAFVHGKGSVIVLNGVDISPYTNSMDYNRSADEHDVTTYGQTGHVKQGGLTDGTCQVGGIYDNTGAGPRATIRPLVGTNVTLLHYPEGIGTGKPLDTATVHVASYNESSPVADMITWASDFNISGAVVSTTQ
jgi:hypothetical protein